MSIVSGVSRSSAIVAIACLLTVGGTVVSAQAVPAVTDAPEPAADFSEPEAFEAGSRPFDVVADDLDGDGDNDLVVTNREAGTVSVLVGAGDGSVGEPVPYSVAPGDAYNVALGSLDPEVDADLDLVVMNPDSGQHDDVAVLRGLTGPTFGQPLDYPGDGVGEDAWIRAAQYTVAIGDFNQDGDQDLAVGTANFSTLSILTGRAGATFSDPTELALDNGSQNMTPVVADFNQDGDLDLAVERAEVVSIMLGGAEATFGPMTDYPLTTSANNIVTDDFDADGDPDLATIHWATPGIVSVMMGDTGGAFTQPVTFPAGGDYSNDLATGDVNNDGVTDLVVASTGFTDTGNVSVHLGEGDGTFAQPQVFAANPRPTAVALSDMDGDTDLDVVVTNAGGGEFYPDQLSILTNLAPAADTLAPDTSITAGPADHAFVLSEDVTLESESTEAGSTFACMLDAATIACPDGTAELTGLGHRTHRFEVAATDSSGNTDAEPATRTWTVPLDDSELSADRFWTRKKAAGGYLAGFSAATRKGATLTKKVSGARELALVVTKAPGYGKVKVFAGQELLGTVSLDAPTRRTRRVVPVATLEEPFTGKLRIVVKTAGRTVRVEGLGAGS